MRLYLTLFVILLHFTGFAQQNQAKQVQFLLEDLHNNYKESIGALIKKEAGDSSYSSRITLEGSMDNEIQVPSNGKWASYTAYISDSCSLKQAKRFAEHWRGVVQLAAPNYKEKEKDGKNKTFSGEPFYGYDFELTEGNIKFWISINYAKRPTNTGYSVILILGKQIF